MQSLSLNINANFNDEIIKSLSDDDDENDENNNNNDNNDNEEKEKEITTNDESESDEQQIIFDYNNNDKDIEIRTTLNKFGYKNMNKLCYTAQGSVWRGKSAKSSEQYDYKSVVIKTASKLHYNDNNTTSEHENILNEIELLQKINKELNKYNCNDIKNSVIKVIDTFETNNNYFVVLEDGGIDLFNFINDCHQQISNEKICIEDWQNTIKIIATKLIKLLDFLHTKMNICHLDISLENVLISNIKWIQYLDKEKNCYLQRLSPDFKIKLIDFGAAQLLNGNFKTKSLIGKQIYCSPQIYNLQNKLSDKCFDGRATDIWSFGVSIFIMAIGCPPWQVPDQQNNKLFQTIVNQKNMDFVLNAWNRSNYINDSMKDVLNKIFICNEQERISANNIIKHNWLNNE